MSRHVALLGDSIFDNRAYTGGEPDVAGHLRTILPSGWGVTLAAVDGAVTADLGSQLGRVREPVTDVVLSIGGNDVLRNFDLMNLPVRSTAEALELFRTRVDAFEAGYNRALDALTGLGRPTTVCTIYNGRLPPEEAGRARIGLTMFNDAILRAAFSRELPVIDLRLVCTEPRDYANPIEPSGPGGRKIALAIASALGQGAARQRTTVFTSRG